ncbi:unnamed protein product [Urochloa humidicola]
MTITPHAAPAKRRRRLLTSPGAASASTAGTIPDDILLTEVLPRLPVRSLVRFRSVCQSWRAAIDGNDDDRRFVRRHLELSHRRAPPSVLDVPCEPRLEDHWSEARSKEMEFRRIRVHCRHGEAHAIVDADLMHVVACSVNRFTAVVKPVHCDGLVLIPTASGELFVCNPATREFVALPPGSPGVMPAGQVAFGFDPWSDTYKVARVVYRGFDAEVVDSDKEIEFDVGHELFTLGSTGGSWEATDDPPYCIVQRSPICTRGAFYWTAVVGCADNPRPTELLRFSLRDETFTVVPNPPCFSQSPDGVIGDHDTLTELGGKLCCAHVRTPTSVDVWLADDDGLREPEWSVAYRIEFPRHIGHSVLPLAVDGDELLLSVDRRVLCKYNAASESLEEVLDMQRAPDLYGRKPALPLRLLHHAVPYVESLVAISRGNY